MAIRTRKIRYSETCATDTAAASYRTKYQRHFHKRVSNRRERALLDRILERAGSVDRVLDVPAGAGRLADVIARRARALYSADYSKEMLRILRVDASALRPRPAVATAFHLPFRDRTFDLVVSIRLSHHIPDRDGRLWHLRELLRVSDRWVLVTFFDSGSFKNRVRELTRRLGSDKRGKHTLSRAEVEAQARERGFAVEGFWRLSSIFSGHTFALLRRI